MIKAGDVKTTNKWQTPEFFAAEYSSGVRK
jgi:hypothetical protein